MADFLETERQNHENGDPVAVHLVALFCLTNNRPVPEWAVPAVEAMVRNAMDNPPDRGAAWRHHPLRRSDGSATSRFMRQLKFIGDGRARL